MDWQEDREFRDGIIKQVEDWTITDEDGWSLTLPHDGAAPRVGDTIRYFGEGIGRPVRGVVLFRDGVPRVSFYRTPIEQAQREAAYRQQEEARRQRELDEERVERATRWAVLPVEFQARRTRFAAANPTWPRDFEAYELFVCEQAWLIAQAFATETDPAAAIHAFSQLPWEKQKELVPGLSDDHSGNTHGFSCRLAHWWHVKPENVTREHGALAPLVGCQAYGCSHAQ